MRIIIVWDELFEEWELFCDEDAWGIAQQELELNLEYLKT